MAETGTTTEPEVAAAGDVVTLRSVSVAYGKNFALRDVTASFGAGAVGLLGPNGAGKSTMIKSLLGFIVPKQGTMKVLGLDVAHKAQDVATQQATAAAELAKDKVGPVASSVADKVRGNGNDGDTQVGMQATP